MGAGMDGSPAKLLAAAPQGPPAIGAIFSDMDGTIVHYPEAQAEHGSWGETSPSGRGLQFTAADTGEEAEILLLPPSVSTGVQGLISFRTLQLVRDIRARGVKFVVISGCRFATMMTRLPWLPASDAIVMENGGRIFLRDPAGLCTTALVEDMAWRARMDHAAGPAAQDKLKPEAREGVLWDFYRRLAAEGWKLDTTSYTTMFRLKTKGAKTEADLQRVLREVPDGIKCSVNLGCTDFYPAGSGKECAVDYLLAKFNVAPEAAVTMCDDNNDLGMAARTGHTYCPKISHASLAAAIEADPASFTVAKRGGTFASDEVLEKILSQVQ